MTLLFVTGQSDSSNETVSFERVSTTVGDVVGINTLIWIYATKEKLSNEKA